MLSVFGSPRGHFSPEKEVDGRKKGVIIYFLFRICYLVAEESVSSAMWPKQLPLALYLPFGWQINGQAYFQSNENIHDFFSSKISLQ